MEKIGREELESIENLDQELDKPIKSIYEIKDEEFNSLMEQMKNPVNIQREFAAKIKIFLDKAIREDMETKGFLSDFTRRWMKDFNDMCDKIQKSLHGDKHLHLHGNISHADIMNKARKYKKVN